MEAKGREWGDADVGDKGTVTTLPVPMTMMPYPPPLEWQCKAKN